MGKDAGVTTSREELIAEISTLQDEVGKLKFDNHILKTQMEASLDGILVVGSDWQMITFNSRFLEMWRIPSHIKLSRNDRESVKTVLDRLKYPEQFLARVEELMANPSQESRDELELLDGRWFDRYSAPIYEKDKSISGRIWFFRDVTELKQARLQLRQQNETLESRVKERTEEMRVLNQDLLSREEELEAKNISLRTLLTTVEEEKKILEDRVVSNFRNVLLPFLDMLRQTNLTNRQNQIIESINDVLDNIATGMNHNLLRLASPLTPAETKVANCIRGGKSSKEIASILNCSERTVEGHRQAIRKKLGLKTGENLLTHLLSLK